ncbi:hypothetical protein [Iningainema tapete]|uniref:DUF2281 domain-containing protein n=1 Tax=Iningainema tapete BLCC-T55 TaxID=2748662 RepID=A0A8J7CB84_9CYAN|nr:hypothetical protein [Iningainema tapete]MBD2778051.1 hypothetical protein [Iningainema tapete BLCC-T55]
MSVHDQTISKIRILPEYLVQEVSDFIDTLLLKHYSHHFTECQEIVESDYDYLINLEDYENRLARGEIKW